MTESPSERSARDESGEIATSTLAEIYAQQGLLSRALSIYRRMLIRAPDDAEIAGRIEKLERRIAESGLATEPGSEAGRPPEFPVRERLPWDAPEKAEPPAAPPRHLGPIDAGAFSAWLEGR